MASSAFPRHKVPGRQLLCPLFAQPVGLPDRTGLGRDGVRVAELLELLEIIPVSTLREAINRGLDLSLEQGLEMESELFAMVVGTEEAKDGLKACSKGKKPEIQ